MTDPKTPAQSRFRRIPAATVTPPARREAAAPAGAGGRKGGKPAAPSRPRAAAQAERQGAARAAAPSAPPRRAPPRRAPRPASPFPADAQWGPALAETSLGYALQRAALVLGQVLEGRNLDQALLDVPLAPGARPAVMDLAYGCLRAYGRAEARLRPLLKSPVQDATVRALLFLALYRLDQRPDEDFTTVDQAVTAAGGLAGGNFRGLVNGVLRNFLRQRASIESSVAGNPEALHQHPIWWIKALQKDWPDDWAAILAAGNTHPPMSLRVNLRQNGLADYQSRLEALGIPARPLADGGDPAGPVGLFLPQPVGVDRLPDFFAGAASVQDAGAQWAARLLDARPGMRVLDACAAPGGKTAHLLERAELNLLALDAEAPRSRRIEENLQRLGLQAQVKTADCRAIKTWWDGRLFDRILADVPCSASGVVRRHPDAKWLRRSKDVSGFAAVQQEIIDALWTVLAPGGKMLYCTCSVFAAENRDQIAAFCDRHADARRLPLAGDRAGSGFDFQLLPNDEHDGFYYALLEKTAHG